jgi:hypothetical protein
MKKGKLEEEMVPMVASTHLRHSPEKVQEKNN